MKEKDKIYLYKFLMSFFSVFSLLLVLTIGDLKLKIILTSLSLIVAISFSYMYYHIANKHYFNTKHKIEMIYFDLVSDTSIKKLLKINREEISNKIFKLSTCATYMYKYFLEAIPSLACALILIIYIGIKESLWLIPIILILSIVTFILRKRKLSKVELIYEDDNKYLREFINKIVTIKKLNIYSFAKNKLNENLEPRYYTYDYEYFLDPLSIILFIIKCGISVVLLLKASTLASLLFVIGYIALSELWLYGLAYGIVHRDTSNKLINELTEELEQKKQLKRASLWHSLTIKDGVLSYDELETSIKVPLFEIEKLDHISIMGKVGEGKSSILNIVSDLYDIQSGEILIDGKKKDKGINNVYLSEDLAIFNMSVRDNLCLGTENSDKRLRELIKEVGLDNWLDDLDNSFNTIIDNDIELTIKEKINLIRAILLDADLYLMDNPTANMELDSEKLVAAVIKKYLNDKTYIIATARPVLTTMCTKHYFIKGHTLMEKESLL